MKTVHSDLEDQTQVTLLTAFFFYGAPINFKQLCHKLVFKDMVNKHVMRR